MGSIPATFLPSLPSGQGVQQVPEARGPQAGPTRKKISAPGDATQPWAHIATAALIPSASPVGVGAQLTGGPGSPRGTAPSRNPGGPCREKGQLLCGCPEGSALPSTLRVCSALGHSRDLHPVGQRSQGNAQPLTLSPRSPFSPCRGKKKQIRAVLGCSYALLE